MNVIRNLILPIAVILMMAGVLIDNVRSSFIPLGLGMLLIGYVLEKLLFKKKRYRIEELSSKLGRYGAIRAEASELLISDRWALTPALKLEGFDGHYQVHISELSDGDCTLISEIRISNETHLSGEGEDRVARIVVDSGWLLFGAKSAIERLGGEVLKSIIQSELKRLPANEPLCVWLKDHETKEVGVVVSTGQGDGTYQINYTIRGGKLAVIEARFIVRTSSGGIR